ncbi:unnamed protein product [Bursaphelenchus okinawaensis]|uniref:RanBP2-type domain-containing protein n=1 Tax=Bursaphelenchus okinawaensis TaxID=465554 RepID=A0A811KYB3_9BILA|nr:unnamed protein product [Bursaphelenchus okinawaensis]CAG9114184.1 unnamed protein product [Bursaphelenchus okinawaensis]
MSGYFNNVYPSNGNNRSYGDRSFDQQQHSASNQNHWRSQEGPNMRGEFGQFPVYPEGSWRQDPFSSNQRQDNSFNGQDWRGSYGQQNERFDAGDQNTQQRYNNQDRNIQQRYGERDRGDQQQQRYDDRDRNAQSQQRYDEKDRSSQRYDDRDRDWRSNEGSVGSRSSHYDDTDRDWRRNDYNEGRSRRDDRDRDYRDSPPSRRDDRDSWKRRGSRERSYRRSSPRRSRSPPRRDNRDTNATNKIMLTAVPEGFDRDEMNIIISQQGFSPIDVRIIHKNSGNGTRSFGFIEFETVDQAREYIKYNNGFLKFPNNFNCRLEYAREPQGGQVPETSRSAGSSAGGPADWNCSKCGINNFNRRENCFKCGINKRDSDELEAKGYSLVGSEPCDTLLVRELPTSANELSIIQAFGFYSTIPIQRVHVGSSKRYCLMQMRSIEEASYFLQAFNRVVPQINNCVVIVSYSRVSLNKVLMADSVEAIKSQTGVSTSQVQKDPTNSAAMLAYNAIQMSKMGRAPNPSDRQTISTPVGVFPIYPKPDSRVFQLEPTTGYFYEPNTGFYYDPKTDYYYDPVTCQWCFWTTEFSTFIPCNGDNMEARERLQQNEKTLKEKEAAVEDDDIQILEDSFLKTPRYFMSSPEHTPITCQSITRHFVQSKTNQIGDCTSGIMTNIKIVGSQSDSNEDKNMNTNRSELTGSGRAKSFEDSGQESMRNEFEVSGGSCSRNSDGLQNSGTRLDGTRFLVKEFSRRRGIIKINKAQNLTMLASKAFPVIIRPSVTVKKIGGYYIPNTKDYSLYRRNGILPRILLKKPCALTGDIRRSEEKENEEDDDDIQVVYIKRMGQELNLLDDKTNTNKGKSNENIQSNVKTDENNHNMKKKVFNETSDKPQEASVTALGCGTFDQTSKISETPNTQDLEQRKRLMSWLMEESDESVHAIEDKINNETNVEEVVSQKGCGTFEETKNDTTGGCCLVMMNTGNGLGEDVTKGLGSESMDDNAKSDAFESTVFPMRSCIARSSAITTRSHGLHSSCNSTRSHGVEASINSTRSQLLESPFNTTKNQFSFKEYDKTPVLELEEDENNSEFNVSDDEEDGWIDLADLQPKSDVNYGNEHERSGLVEMEQQADEPEPEYKTVGEYWHQFEDNLRIFRKEGEGDPVLRRFGEKNNA